MALRLDPEGRRELQKAVEEFLDFSEAVRVYLGWRDKLEGLQGGAPGA